ncbi:MAG: histidine phosphatase family protein [Thermomonas sp.]
MLFVRHGQSQSNAGGPTMDDALIPLTELGHAQALHVAKRLPASPSRIVASPYLRAMDTARAYAALTGLGIDTNPELREFHNIDADLLRGMTGEQRRPISRSFWERGDPHERMGPRAETFAEFSERVQRFIERDLRELQDGTVVFGHGRWIGLLGWKLQGRDSYDADGMRAFWDYMCALQMPNTAIYRVRADASGQYGFEPAFA